MQIMDELGTGQYGQVLKAWLATEKIFVAVKTCKGVSTSEDRKDFMAEAVLLANFQHKNVLGLKGVVMTSQPWQIVIEYMPYGDLRANLKDARKFGVSVQEREKLTFAAQIADGMAYLGELNFVHRDLAARNILLSEKSRIKVADFGLSRQLADEGTYTLVRTQLMLPIKWMAPECITVRKFSPTTDVWAFGVVLWEIATLGKTPYKKMAIKTLAVDITDGYRMPMPSDCSKYIYEVMMQCWSLTPPDRPTFTALSTKLVGMMRGPVSRDFGKTISAAKAAASGGNAAAESGAADGSAYPKFEVPPEDLRLVRDLGEGAYGQVVLMEVSSGPLASDLSGQSLIAAKMLKADANESMRVAFMKELAMMASKEFSHPNIISLVGVCTLADPLLILLEYMDIGDLQMYLEAKAEDPESHGLSEADTFSILEQVANGCVCGARFWYRQPLFLLEGCYWIPRTACCQFSSDRQSSWLELEGVIGSPTHCWLEASPYVQSISMRIDVCTLLPLSSFIICRIT
jgi:serine/threonine protein kinase